MDLFSSMPVEYINALSFPFSWIVVFCATTLGTITIVATVLYIFLRPIKEVGVFAPLEILSDRVHDFFAIGITTFGAYIASVFLKNLFAVPRPFLVDPSIHALIQETDFSFPSGHATTFMALAVILFSINHKAGKLAFIAALIIGIARIFAGVHTPLDILAGYVLGGTFALIASHIFKILSAKKN